MSTSDGKRPARHRLFGLLAALLGLLGVLLALEIGLRFLPVNQTLGSLPVNESNPMLRFLPNRTTVWSEGPTFCLTNTVHSNNYGFINDQDYDPQGAGPLLAVVGDSFVEALMVPYPRTGQGVLARELAGRARVYSFARAGAPLSQYLASSRWAVREFHPRRLVVVVVSNDFDESLLQYKSDGGFHYYAKNADGGLDLVRQDYLRGLGALVVPHSRLLLYLLTNLRVQTILRQLSYRLSPPERFAGQTEAAYDGERLTDSQRAVDQVLLDFQHTGLAPADICFVVDGLRPDLYTPEGQRAAASSYAGIMNAYFMDHARRAGFAVIDMQPIFLADYAVNHGRFEYPCDPHWNERGHFLFAKAVLDSGFLKDWQAGAKP